MAKKRKKQKQGKGAKRSGPRMAKQADRHRLYEESVQEPESDVTLMRRVFKKRFGRPPRLMREDFCGTAALCCSWVSSNKQHRAWGIDLDPDPLEWGREKNLALLDQEQAKRVELVQGDVLEAEQIEKVDITCAFNFSYFLFQDRELLLRYFRTARETLRDEGLLFLDAYGGADAQRTMVEKREQEGFDYVWDQDEFDPITHHVINHIHFEFPDGSKLRKAFTYDWRLWTLPELRDILLEAGFSTVEIYWEGTDKKTGEGNGVYTLAKKALDDPAWVTYIVAVR